MTSIHITSPIKDVVIGPSHDAVVNTAIECGRRGMAVTYKTTWQNTYLANARTDLLKHALTTKAERILWVDSDMLFTPEDVFALLAIDADMVSGMYTTKERDAAVVGDFLDGAPKHLQLGTMLEMKSVGFGFVVMTRRVAERMIEKHGDNAFAMVDDGQGTILASGDDMAFCHRWRGIGGRIFMHTGVRLGHIGYQAYGV